MDSSSSSTNPLRTPPRTPPPQDRPQLYIPRRAGWHPLTRDQKLQVQTLRRAGWKYSDIAVHLGLTYRQVEVTCHNRVTPKKRKGRPSITDEMRQELVTYVCQSKLTRRMPYLKLAITLGWRVLEDAIRRALWKEGFRRRVARLKPPITETNRMKRLQWAIEHRNWTKEQWDSIMWSNETWVTDGKHTRQFVTRRVGEEYDPTCIVEKRPRKQGWMFWGTFSGRYGKGPSVFWEKSWGSIRSDSYIEHIVPTIHEYLSHHWDLVFMQDGAPGHSAKATVQEMQLRGIRLIFWPPFSPDLNPIETVWNVMKDWMQDNYPEKMTITQTRRAVQMAWEVVGDALFRELLDQMPARCQAVIDANGMHTKY